MFRPASWWRDLFINTPSRELYRTVLIVSSEKTWWCPLLAETCSFLVIKNITSN